MVRLRVLEGGGQSDPSLPVLREALQVARNVLRVVLDPETHKPKFTSLRRFHDALKGEDFQLADRQEYGPPGGYQLIYQGRQGVIVKVKTKGYAGGRRRGQPTMSVELTDGVLRTDIFDGEKQTRTGWDNTWGKIDADGRLIPKDIIAFKDRVTADATGKGRVEKQRGDGLAPPRPISRFEVLEGGLAEPVDKDAFADRGHLDFPSDFDDMGVESLL
jgi:hypothetical protein